MNEKMADRRTLGSTEAAESTPRAVSSFGMRLPVRLEDIALWLIPEPRPGHTFALWI